jgi:hypothetical protein
MPRTARETTVRALPHILDRLDADGLRTGPLDGCQVAFRHAA